MEDSMIDETYEFSAPKFYDFINGETEEETRNAELWFETALSHAPSPFMLRIKTERSVQVASLCDFGDADQTTKQASETSDSANTSSNMSQDLALKPDQNPNESDMKENANPNMTNEEINKNLVNLICDAKEQEVANKKKSTTDGSVEFQTTPPDNTEEANNEETITSSDACTPKPPTVSARRNWAPTESKRQQTAKKIASALKNPSALRSKMQAHLSQAKSSKPASVKRDTNNLKNSIGTPSLVQENQAIKRQKLEGGKSRQILNIKPPNLPHKSRPGMTSRTSNLCPSTVKSQKGERKIYVREPAVPAAPFVSMAEMMKKFQSSTRGMSLPQSLLQQDDAGCIMQGKPKLTLTRPKEPEFETTQRVRSVKVKSSVELEEEMMAKMPKFKARPLNKKILEAPTLPALLKSVPHPPEFHEFHLETMARAHKNADVSSVVSTESSYQNNQWKPHLTEPKTPVLQTSLRARPVKVKSSLDIEQEELEKIPKFKARPLNKKIFESKGELGMFHNTKKQVTIPQEFHFAIDQRIPPSSVADMFDKLSLNSEPHHENQLPRNTKLNPFHLHTEERGMEKEMKFVMELMQKQIEEERARIPRANPYPYTTDYPVIPPKPEPKQCTRPEPFQLESLDRHEEEIRREMEERQRKEREEARMRIFKAQPISKEDPIPLPEKERKPLTEVHGFNLHVEHRAVDRAEFDKKVKEKEMIYKRYREEAEAARQMEEEKALKQLRRTLVPHARPVPSFANPFIPQKANTEMTKAKSPKLRVQRRKERRELMMTKAATSTAAAHMR